MGSKHIQMNDGQQANGLDETELKEKNAYGCSYYDLQVGKVYRNASGHANLCERHGQEL